MIFRGCGRGGGLLQPNQAKFMELQANSINLSEGNNVR